MTTERKEDKFKHERDLGARAKKLRQINPALKPKPQKKTKK